MTKSMTGRRHGSSRWPPGVVGRVLLLLVALVALDIGLVHSQDASTIVGDWRGEWRNSLHGVFRGRMRLRIHRVEGRAVHGYITVEATDHGETDFRGELADRQLTIPALGIEGTVEGSTIHGTGDGSKVITRSLAGRGRYSFTLTKQP